MSEAQTSVRRARESHQLLCAAVPKLLRPAIDAERYGDTQFGVGWQAMGRDAIHKPAGVHRSSR